MKKVIVIFVIVLFGVSLWQVAVQTAETETYEY
jgi:type IV secretory pathway TrbD component